MRIAVYSFVALFIKLPFREPFRENPLPLPGSFRDWVFFYLACFEDISLEQLMGNTTKKAQPPARSIA